MIVYVKHCKLADYEHSLSKRQYAHTWHKGSNIICVAKAFYSLSRKIKIGLLAHEVGHLIDPEASELEVDKIGGRALGVRVKRKDFPEYGRNLETI